MFCPDDGAKIEPLSGSAPTTTFHPCPTCKVVWRYYVGTLKDGRSGYLDVTD